jgi:hypothetical protein
MHFWKKIKADGLTQNEHVTDLALIVDKASVPRVEIF